MCCSHEEVVEGWGCDPTSRTNKRKGVYGIMKIEKKHLLIYFMILKTMDSVTSSIGLSLGAVEMSPLTYSMGEIGIFLALLLSFVLSVGIMILLHNDYSDLSRRFMWIIDVVITCVVINNIWVLIYGI